MTKPEETLKACPFCGGDVLERNYGSQHSIGCDSCHHEMSVVFCYAVSSDRYNSLSAKEYKSKEFKKECIENIRQKWNTRTTPDKDRVMQLMAEALGNLVLVCEEVGDFRNGVTDPMGTMDEGQVYAGKYLSKSAVALAEYAKIKGEL